MRFLFKFIFFIILLSAFGGVAYGFYRTFLSERDPNQKIFSLGTYPSPLPDGLLKGTVDDLTVSWKGKKMNAKTGTGINIFAGKSVDEERYPFKTSKEKGLRDPNLDVLRIDYNLPQNPFWLRRITDEIVQVKRGEYLGKVHVRVIPNYPFTLGYFHLQK